jgi:Rieske Fe-S protein
MVKGVFVNETEATPQTTRRNVLLGAGALGTVAVLAACGTSDGNGSGNPDTVTPGSTFGTSTGTRGSADQSLGPSSEIPVGGGKIFTDENIVVTQPQAGTFKGFNATCTHQGCQVSKVADGTIQCMCHGSQFSIVDGSVQVGPAPRPLGAANISVADGKISLA